MPFQAIDGKPRREQFPQVSGAPWACRELFTKYWHRCLDIDITETLAGDTAPPFLAAHPDRGKEEPVVSGRDHVNRAAQQRALNHPPLFERRRQRVAPEIAHARPEADVSRWRVLRLKPYDAFERRHERHGRAFEEELAGEQGPIELSGRQETFWSFRFRCLPAQV